MCFNYFALASLCMCGIIFAAVASCRRSLVKVCCSHVTQYIVCFSTFILRSARKNVSKKERHKDRGAVGAENKTYHYRAGVE